MNIIAQKGNAFTQTGNGVAQVRGFQKDFEDIVTNRHVKELMDFYFKE